MPTMPMRTMSCSFMPGSGAARIPRAGGDGTDETSGNAGELLVVIARTPCRLLPQARSL
jgi:hypothetical protein